MIKTENKKNFCYCCHEDKDVKMFFIKKSKKAYTTFCKVCYLTKTREERDSARIQFVINALTK